jgi:hypothetical protein
MALKMYLVNVVIKDYKENYYSSIAEGVSDSQRILIHAVSSQKRLKSNL